jgi:hypothetical protein
VVEREAVGDRSAAVNDDAEARLFRQRISSTTSAAISRFDDCA